jgi:hypothetical protein
VDAVVKTNCNPAEVLSLHIDEGKLVEWGAGLSVGFDVEFPFHLGSPFVTLDVEWLLPPRLGRRVAWYSTSFLTLGRNTLRLPLWWKNLGWWRQSIRSEC